MEKVIAYLDQIATAEGDPLSEACKRWLLDNMEFMSLDTSDFLLLAGDVCRNLYFIVEGLLKCFYIVDDVEVPDWFFGASEAVVSIDSFYDQIPEL